MPANSLYKDTAKRLREYGVFSDETIKIVASFAEKQAEYKDYRAFFEAARIPTPDLYVNERGEGVVVVDIAATKPEQGVLVVHLPMANPLDANQLYQVAAVVTTNPAYRVIAFGNPSGAPFAYKQQNLTLWKRFGIGSLRNLQPLVSAELEYLEARDIKNAHHVGYSYGAHKALIEVSYAKSGSVESLALIDPVAHPRGLKQLVENFKSTFQPMGEYVNRTKLQTYFDARNEAAKTKHHDKALRRQINIAIGFMMARFDMMPFLEKLLEKQPKLKVIVAWGGKSELGNNAHLSTRLHRLKYEIKADVHPMRLEDDAHAFANDVCLYAAIIAESLRK